MAGSHRKPISRDFRERTGTVAFALGLASLLAACATTGTRFSADDEAIVRERHEALRESTLRGGGLTSYDPTEPVRGAARIAPMPMAQAMQVDKAALDAAEAFAAERNSSAFIVAEKGRIVREAYFGGNDADSTIISKSLAKPLTAVLVGRAIALGHIESLDQKAADFITEWKDDPVRSRITLRQFLGMRSGFEPQGSTADPTTVMTRAYLHPRHDEVIIHEYALTSEPGTRYDYSNANSEIIAPIIERATGMRYSQFITTALLEPLGAKGGEVWVNRPGGTAHAGCCIMLPPRTWVKIAQLLLQGGKWNGAQLLPPGYVDAMRTADPVNPHHGLGVWVTGPYVEARGSAHPSVPFGKTRHSAPYLDRELFLFDGNSNQVVYVIPSLEMVVLRTGGDTPEGKPWDNVFIPNLLISNAIAGDSIQPPVPQPGPVSGG